MATRAPMTGLPAPRSSADVAEALRYGGIRSEAEERNSDLAKRRHEWEGRKHDSIGRTRKADRSSDPPSKYGLAQPRSLR